MNWVVIVIGANFFWALTNIGDKYVVSKRVKNPYVYMVWLTLLELVVIVLIPFVDFVLPEAKIMLLLLLAGFMDLYASMLYIKAVQLEDISRINLWWSFVPIFSLLLAWLFLGEKLSQGQLIAFVILIIGGFIASFHLKRTKIIFSKAFLIMMASTFMFSAYMVTLHHVLNYMSFISGFIWLRITLVFWLLPLLLISSFRSKLNRETKNLFNKKLFFIVLAVVLVDNMGTLLNTWGLSLGPVALINAVGGTQMIFVFVIAILISIFAPKILKEELDRRNVILKIVALILMVVGVLLINLG